MKNILILSVDKRSTELTTNLILRTTYIPTYFFKEKLYFFQKILKIVSEALKKNWLWLFFINHQNLLIGGGCPLVPGQRLSFLHFIFLA